MVLGFSRVVDCLVDAIVPWNAVASIVLLPSAADQLPFPFRALAQSPQLTVFLAGGGYLVFLVLFLPLYAISFIVTATGAWAVLLGAVYAGGRGLTQTISYPGQSRQIQRELEMEYTKNVSARLTSFANAVRLWLQLVRDVTVVPSGMNHFRILHEEVRERAVRGDVWIVTRALEELTAHANMQIEEAGGATRSGSAAATMAVVVAATAAGANALAPEAKAEVEALLDCLTELLPLLGEVLQLASKLVECKNTNAFDRARQTLLTPGAAGSDRFASACDRLEARTAKLTRLSTQLRSHNKRKAAGTGGGSTPRNGRGSGAAHDTSPAVADEEEGVVVDFDTSEDADGAAEEDASPASKLSGFPGAMVKSWWKARSPYDGAAGFPLMRQEMLIRSNAQQIWLTMSDGTLLDCCYARAYGGRCAVSGDGSGAPEGEGNDRSSTGCVLFCNPNAGFWESIVLAGEGNPNWVTFYTSTGCDVFLFNYRGYGRSGGKASPKAINKDVREVVGFLREELGVTRLAVHGESIGGVAAASAARHCQVDLLILDRTFSSLSAIGQRMLGGWTKWAIWGFTGWKADVSSDYLACRCYKVLACDPEDVVIADTASAKSGMAVTVELGSSSAALDVYHPPTAYKVADHTKSRPPSERVSLPLSPQERLTHLQIAHFTACLRYIARKAPRIGQVGPSPLSRRRRRRREGSSDEGSAREVEMVDMGNAAEIGQEAVGTAEENDGVGGGNPHVEGVIDALRPLGEVWITLARVDGLCGRTLGRAVARGFDDVRTWVCCLVVFGPVVRADAIALSADQADAIGSVTVETACHRLQTLIKEHPEEVGSDPSIAFASDMLHYLAKRLNNTQQQPSSRCVDTSGGMGGVGVEGNRGGGRASGSAVVAGVNGALEEGLGYGVGLVGEDRDDLLDNGPSLGRLLPLHCGHNNAYSDGERRMLLEHLALEGWVAPDRRPLEGIGAGTPGSYASTAFADFGGRE